MPQSAESENSALDRIARLLENHLLWLLPVSVVLIIIGPWLFTRDIPSIPGFGSGNEVGDTFGGITAPIIGLITIMLLFLTYQFQKNELQETRATANKQAEIMAQQQFENTFFELLKVHRENTEKIRKYGGEEEFGRRAFASFKEKFEEILKTLYFNEYSNSIRKNSRNSVTKQ
jgi:hypothetical protein